MMGSYYVGQCKNPSSRDLIADGSFKVAILSTVYFFVLTIFGNRSAVKGQPGASKMNNIITAFSDTVGPFLDAALVFAVSILASAVVRYGLFSRYMNTGNIDPDDFSSYRLIGAVAMSVYCVFPCLVLQTVAGDLRLRWLRLSLWTVIVVFTIVVETLYMYRYEGRFWGAVSNNWKTSNIYEGTPAVIREAFWLEFCDDKALLGWVKTSTKAGAIILGVQCAWLLYYIVANAYIKLKGKDAFDGIKECEIFGVRIRKWLMWMRRVNGLLCGITMWVSCS